MKIVLATNNKDKVKEIKAFYNGYEIYALSEICEPFEIDETGASFKENALIKARAVYAKLCELKLENEFIALSDDSGISVEALGFAPGIYSARYSGKDATDASNREKLACELHKIGLKKSRAFYTACIAVASKFGDFNTHGFMYGTLIDEERGDNGFGYDFMFMPDGFEQTIGQLDVKTKLAISHRSKGLELAKYILKSLEKYYK
ncbi:non-canonical purine NTP pyrophosphatase [Campylobacter fetus]|uniref:dITP/XTP pyrophosphatase n=1 Tax=Campylobacter fetus subsp. testudinum TaxID=1507806 RepID=A0AAX0HC22_CAMFE|nr:non-canonical purine NTP pyrophosphatase [Campylobacter fetus]AJB44925.1 nucleoside-triphosphate diphosphatase [Campylobacter fetus subsp. testudinum]ALV64263.1 putative dITP/XTP pyrophosphatase [Campylobacter fetus subsp. testudinum Sp3]AVK80544.1 non-canonical purine NTP pyrophosphatase [Campylobacter fetus subsp. testudinum]EAK0830174.1 non-canonical purine NTP pyrophosphatase [Campylobacter fetus]OCR85689.1 nucleoside-triphosphate diphosphatase [Campylobacter fetus subsp. testudinum]